MDSFYVVKSENETETEQLGRIVLKLCREKVEEEENGAAVEQLVTGSRRRKGCPRKIILPQEEPQGPLPQGSDEPLNLVLPKKIKLMKITDYYLPRQSVVVDNLLISKLMREGVKMEKVEQFEWMAKEKPSENDNHQKMHEEYQEKEDKQNIKKKRENNEDRHQIQIKLHAELMRAKKRNIKIPKGSHPCEICGKTFGFYSQLRQHRQRHATKICYQANCDFEYFKKIHLQKHLEEDHGLLKNEIKCEECNVCFKRFKTKSKLTRHRESHDKYGIYPCKHCSTTFFFWQTRKTHEKKCQNKYNQVQEFEGKEDHEDVFLKSSVKEETPENNAKAEQKYCISSAANAAIDNSQELDFPIGDPEPKLEPENVQPIALPFKKRHSNFTDFN